ncbi:hypothetical protein [Sinorhizobium fredii]|uniref:hypothetical protein n=1 Tax=Rhizobium fredii TaxID=380 RepID=UPI00130473FF|nr:hypothetical protein [Sinorhizobium fredii]
MALLITTMMMIALKTWTARMGNLGAQTPAGAYVFPAGCKRPRIMRCSTEHLQRL